jgi:phosphatidylserine/phosphatidylglycerophosphate/cardiolipin synthase-like enzyme
MVRLSSGAAALAAVEKGRDIAMIGYTIQSRPLLHALEDAALRGARVTVRLEGEPYGDPSGSFAGYNRKLAASLRHDGVRVHVTHGSADGPMHAKALAIDGRAYLDDRNWARNDLILRDDDRADAAAVCATAAGGAVVGRSAFALQKREALCLEARMLQRAGAHDRVTVETETFGTSNAVCRALDDLGKRGLHPQLLVQRRPVASNPRERAALARLARDGVEVRTTNDTEKFAVCGPRAWIGSANASPAFGDPDIIDWGACTRNQQVVNAVATRLTQRWEQGRPFTAPAARNNRQKYVPGTACDFGNTSIRNPNARRIESGKS